MFNNVYKLYVSFVCGNNEKLFSSKQKSCIMNELKFSFLIFKY